MKPPLSFLLVSAICLHVLPSRALAQTDNLEGRWKIVAVPDGWKKVPGTNVVIAAGEVRVCIGRLITCKMTYKLDPRHAAVDSVRTVNGKPVIQRGTYRRHGDTLVLSVGPEGKERPASPDATTGGAMRWVFQRAG